MSDCNDRKKVNLTFSHTEMFECVTSGCERVQECVILSPIFAGDSLLCAVLGFHSSSVHACFACIVQDNP